MMKVTDDEYYAQHAALLGHVTLAWNDCHNIVLAIYHILSAESWNRASATFLAQNSDHNRRGITLTLMKEVLNTKNDEPMRELGTELLDKLGKLAVERNLATHTMWVTVMPDREFFPEAQLEIRPDPNLPRPKNLQDDFKSQFSNLTTRLRQLFRDLLDFHAGLRVHLDAKTAERGKA